MAPKRQKELPGMEKPRIKELDDAMAAFAESGRELKAAKKKHDERKDRLVEVARKHGQRVYRDDTHSPPLTLVVEDGPVKLKVTEASGFDGGTDDEEDDGEGEAPKHDA